MLTRDVENTCETDLEYQQKHIPCFIFDLQSTKKESIFLLIDDIYIYMYVNYVQTKKDKRTVMNTYDNKDNDNVDDQFAKRKAKTAT